MNKKQVLATAFIAVLLFSGLVGVQFVRLAAANFGPLPTAHVIYIKSDGSIDPSTAPIKRVGDVYTFTGSMLLSTDHYHFIEIQRDNIVVDGAGYILESYGHNGNSGIKLKDRSNVTIKNIEIRQFQWGITLLSSSNNTITRNNILNNAYGIQLHGSSNNIVSENNIRDNYYLGIQIDSSNYNHIVGNNIILYRNFSWMHGIEFRSSSNNVIAGNNITNHENGIGFRSSSNNIFYHNNFINNQKQVDDDYFDAWYREYYPSMVLSVNIWDNGAEGNYWSDYNGTDNNGDGIGDTPYVIDADNQDNYPLMNSGTGNNGDGIGDTPYVIDADNQDNYPLMNPVNTSTVEIPSLVIRETPIAPAENLTPSQPLIAMPEEYINYTICRVNGSLWAKVDGTYPLHKIFGAGDVFKLDGVEYAVLSDELPLVYPTPPGATNISVKMNKTELNWSNYTENHPEALHHTAIGDWPMIFCTIHPVPDYFTLKIHYEHPIILINGSYTFLYDLNISPYLSPWCTNSTAYFGIRMETDYTNLHMYTVGSNGAWNPINYTIIKENIEEIVDIKITSEYHKPLPGDLVITFAENSLGSSLPMEYGYAMVAVIVAVATVAGYLFFKRKKSATATETSIAALKGEIVNE